MDRKRSITAGMCAAITAVALAAPGAWAAGDLAVRKEPSAAAGTVTGTVPLRNVITGTPTKLRDTIIDCGDTCQAEIRDYQTCSLADPLPACTSHLETVRLTQSAAEGWQFAGWTGCTDVSSDGACERQVDSGGQPVLAVVGATYEDVAAPTVALSGPVEDAKLHGVVPIGATAADNAGVTHVAFFINGDEVAQDTNGSNGWSASFDTGDYAHAQVITVKAVAYDAAGHSSVLDADDSRTYRIDNQTGLHFDAPTPAQDEWIGIGDPAVQVAFAKNADTPADDVTLECNLGAGFEPCASPLASAAFATDGAHTVIVRATDDAAPVPNTAQISRAFRVDRTAPQVQLTRPAEGSTQFPTFTPGLAVSEANPAAVACSLDGAAFVACARLSALAGGHHALRVRALDKAGNQTLVTHGFEVDGTPPQVQVTGGPAENEIVRTSSVRFTFAASDPSGPLARSCRIDGGFGRCTSATAHARSGLAEGAHVFELRVTDGAGNARTVRRDFVVNAVRPTAVITDGPSDGAIVRAAEATFRFSATGGSVQCSLDSETGFGPCSGGDFHRVAGLGDGGHTFRVRVRDASNDEVVASRTFTVDTTAPPPPREILNPSLSSRFKAFRRFTVYRRLVLRGVPAGARVTVTCKGRRCPHGTLKRFAKRRLRAGTRITIRVTKADTVGKQFVIRIRRAKAPRLTISQIS